MHVALSALAESDLSYPDGTLARVAETPQTKVHLVEDCPQITSESSFHSFCLSVVDGAAYGTSSNLGANVSLVAFRTPSALTTKAILSRSKFVRIMWSLFSKWLNQVHIATAAAGW